MLTQTKNSLLLSTLNSELHLSLERISSLSDIKKWMIHLSLVQSAIKVDFLKYIFFRSYKPSTKFRFYKLFTTVLPCYRHCIWIKAPSDLCIAFIPYVHNRSIDHTCSLVLLHCFKIHKGPFEHQQLPFSVGIWANVWKTGNTETTCDSVKAPLELCHHRFIKDAH